MLKRIPESGAPHFSEKVRVAPPRLAERFFKRREIRVESVYYFVCIVGLVFNLGGQTLEASNENVRKEWDGLKQYLRSFAMDEFVTRVDEKLAPQPLESDGGA